MYNAFGVIANYFKPLAENHFIFSDTFPDMLKKWIIVKTMKTFIMI